jgi:glycosyltransferase involved in cell wall biosynthesis
LEISIIIPAYNAQKTINKCLDSLLHQSINKSRYEIIVIDDGSTDTTLQRIKEYEGVRVITQTNQGPAAARNLGAREAKGEKLLFTDADCKPDFHWVEEMIKPLANPDIVGVKGIYVTEQKEIIARFVQIEYEDKYDKMRRVEFIDFVDTYSAAFRRGIFINMGGFDISFPVACIEDIDFSFKLANKGYKMVFNPKAVVCHRHPSTIKDYVKKKYKFAYWRLVSSMNNPTKVVNDSHTPQVMKLQVILSAFIILGVPFCFVFKSGFIFFISVLVIYCVSTLPFVIKASRKDIFVGLLSIFLLFLRSIAQFMGLMAGAHRISRHKN